MALVACLLASVRGPASAKNIGSLTDGRIVTKTLPRATPAPMENTQPVLEEMEVATAKGDSHAVFAIGKAQGVVAMGPESRFLFEQGQFDDKEEGQLVHVSLRVAFGRFRFLFAPPQSSGIHPKEVLIHSGGEGSKIPPVRIAGTDVFLHVERNGMTTLYVEEGSAVVGEPGDEVRVGQGQWTMFGPGLPPQPPAKLDRHPTTGPLRYGQPEIPAPALLDPSSIRFDLPKARLP